MKRIIALSLVVALGALAACSSPVAPSGQAKHNEGRTGYSRYMLASGYAPMPGCTDNGDGTQSCPPAERQ